MPDTPPPIAHLPSRLARLREAAGPAQTAFGDSRRRGYKARDELAAAVGDVLDAIRVTAEREEAPAVLALLDVLDGFPEGIAEATTGCEGPAPLTCIAVAEILHAEGVDTDRHKLGKAARVYPASLLYVRANGTCDIYWIASVPPPDEPDLEDLLADLPGEYVAVVRCRRPAYWLARRRSAQSS